MRVYNLFHQIRQFAVAKKIFSCYDMTVVINNNNPLIISGGFYHG
ncbi:hypothetical protein HMPREF1250_1171 [Megasphaera vaginalis (ex Srinivasan et al. 2021)]|uniref:Uncharacterized protein n=1 Tax=Megasphaera vaginalis (ex Srinivasan et al. 2021) TaxID=1111454 RepID=U7UHD1_9FIRM|nr:hypothetical protein HMPREF1250_1171 [Megasphaera vaginalis (ex Srinivasan et al. 2021)]